MPELHPLDDLGAYSLGALDGEERTRVEAHLAGCEECRTEIGAYRELAAVIAQRPALAYPPAGTWERIAARLERLDAPLVTTSRTVAQRRSERLRLVVLGWAATAAVLVGFAGWFTWDQLNSGGGADVAQLASGGDGIVVPLAGTNASGRLYISEDRKDGGMAVMGLAVLGSNETYEVWFVRHDQTRWSSGTFNVDSRGQALVKVAMPASLDDFDGVAISTEPAGGSDTWGADVLAGPLYER